MIFALALQMGLTPMWYQPAPQLTERERAVLECFQEEQWVDREEKSLQECLARIPEK